jgi:hypothetical protein
VEYRALIGLASLTWLVCAHLLLLLLLSLQASNFCSGMQCKPNRRNKTATYWLEVETPRDYNINGEQPACESAPALTC